MSFVAATLIALCSPSPLPVLQPVSEAGIVITVSPQETASPVSSYAERERAASDLEQFRGGSAGLVILIVLVVAVLVLVAIIVPW